MKININHEFHFSTNSILKKNKIKKLKDQKLKKNISGLMDKLVNQVIWVNISDP
jgi:hypothetical protein